MKYIITLKMVIQIQKHLLVNQKLKKCLKSRILIILISSYLKSNYLITENHEEIGNFVKFLNSINRLNYEEKKKLIEYKPQNEIDMSIVRKFNWLDYK